MLLHRICKPPCPYLSGVGELQGRTAPSLVSGPCEARIHEKGTEENDSHVHGLDEQRGLVEPPLNNGLDAIGTKQDDNERRYECGNSHSVHDPGEATARPCQDEDHAKHHANSHGHKKENPGWPM